MNKHLNKLNLEVTELETQVGDNPECRVGDKTLQARHCSQGPTSPGGFSTLTLELLWSSDFHFTLLRRKASCFRSATITSHLGWECTP